jgi:hypothetical protein
MRDFIKINLFHFYVTLQFDIRLYTLHDFAMHYGEGGIW